MDRSVCSDVILCRRFARSVRGELVDVGLGRIPTLWLDSERISRPRQRTCGQGLIGARTPGGVDIGNFGRGPSHATVVSILADIARRSITINIARSHVQVGPAAQVVVRRPTTVEGLRSVAYHDRVIRSHGPFFGSLGGFV